MAKNENGYYWANSEEINRRAAMVVSPPVAEPFIGAFVAGIATNFIAKLTLTVAGSDLSENSTETVAIRMGLACFAVTYLVLRAQGKSYWREVERQTQLMRPSIEAGADA